MGYCRIHNCRWKDDEERDEQFACPICETYHHGELPPDESYDPDQEEDE